MRQFLAAAVLSAAAMAGMLGAIGPVGAADMPTGPQHDRYTVHGCAAPLEEVDLFTTYGFPPNPVPTVPGRTPYFYCVTGATLLPNEIPPPPEYCCG